MNDHKDVDTSLWADYYPQEYEKQSLYYHAKRFGSNRGQYDLYETIQSLQYLIQKLNLKSQGLNVLDVACGTGKVSIPLAQRGANLTCLDAAEGMLQQCYRRAVENQVEQNIHLKCGKAEQIPFDKDLFEFAISTRFLHLFPPSCYPIFINEMIRVVKPGGHVVVEIKNKYYGLISWSVHHWRQKRQGKVVTSAMSISEVRRLQDRLVGGRIMRVNGCQLPKAQWFSSDSYTAAVLRKLSRTVLGPVSFLYFVVIQKD